MGGNGRSGEGHCCCGSQKWGDRNAVGHMNASPRCCEACSSSSKIRVDGWMTAGGRAGAAPSRSLARSRARSFRLSVVCSGVDDVCLLTEARTESEVEGGGGWVGVQWRGAIRIGRVRAPREDKSSVVCFPCRPNSMYVLCKSAFRDLVCTRTLSVPE